MLSLGKKNHRQAAKGTNPFPQPSSLKTPLRCVGLSFCFKIPWTPGDLWPPSTYVHKVSDRPNCWSQTRPGAWYSPHEEQAAEEQLLMKCLKKLQGRHKPVQAPGWASGRAGNCNGSSSLGTLLLAPLSAFPLGPAPVSAAVALSLH